MPTYSYRCTVCANEFDVRQSFNDDPLTTCEYCGGQLRKLFSSVGVVFKGSGFYRTDSKSTSSVGAKPAKSAKDTSASDAKPSTDTTASASSSASASDS